MHTPLVHVISKMSNTTSTTTTTTKTVENVNDFSVKFSFMSALAHHRRRPVLHTAGSLLPPLRQLAPVLPLGEAPDVHHEHPGQGVHGHAPTLDEEAGPGRDQFAVQHGSAHKHPHEHKEQHERQVHDLAQRRLVASSAPQEPARLQQGVGDLAAEEDSAGLHARLAQPQREHDAQDADGVVGQHDRALCAEVHAPHHVEDEVAQAQHHGADLQRGVLGACVRNGQEKLTVTVGVSVLIMNTNYTNTGEY